MHQSFTTTTTTTTTEDHSYQGRMHGEIFSITVIFFCAYTLAKIQTNLSCERIFTLVT